MTKPGKIATALAIVFFVLYILLGIWCMITTLQLIPSFMTLNVIEDEWHDSFDESFTQKVPMETTKNIIDAEAWRIIYKFPMRPFARYTVHFIGDGSVSESELEKLALGAAESADNTFGGKKTKVEIYTYENDDGSCLYHVVFLKRCVSLYRIW